MAMAIGLALVPGLGRAAEPQTLLVSVSSAGEQGIFDSSLAQVSRDGRIVTYLSAAPNLVPGDSDAFDVFVRDLAAGTTSRVSVSSSGGQADGNSDDPAISGDGRFVAFRSAATNLVPDDGNGTDDAFVHDRVTGITSKIPPTIQANGYTNDVDISADGRYVAFASAASNLVPGDTNGVVDAFVFDRVTLSITRASVSSSGGQALGSSQNVAISPNGRYVAFDSVSDELVPGDTNPWQDLFVHDMTTVSTIRVQRPGIQPDAQSLHPSFSGDSRILAFDSWATNLTTVDYLFSDVFLYDLVSGAIEIVSETLTGEHRGGRAPSVSTGGRYVAFQIGYSNPWDIVLHDRLTNTTTLVSASPSGDLANGESGGAVLSSDALTLAWHSHASNLVAGDANGVTDVFARRLGTCRVGVYEHGPLSGPIHDQLEPLVGPLGPPVHRLNCLVVVPIGL